MITETSRHPLVTDYLHRLDRALADAPRPAARELHDQIAMHLDDALGQDASELEVRAALDQLGAPEVLAAEITPPRQPVRRARWVDVAGLLLISIGSLVLPVVGWLAGAVLVASSPRFTRWQKAAGVLIWPVGLLLPVASLALASGFSLPPALDLPLAGLAIALPLGVVTWLAASLKA